MNAKCANGHRLMIGTVQFGLPYGIANSTGQVGIDEAASILHHAWSMGIDTLDTAILYDESEHRLGQIGVRRWQVISKLPAIPESCPDVTAWVQASVAGSLDRIGVTRLYGVLLHRPQQLLSPQGREIYTALEQLRNKGTIGKVGISINSPDQLDAIWPEYRFDLVQAPLNIIDRRLLTSGWLERLHKGGTEVHVRSIFMQGLLLMRPEKRPEYFQRWCALWANWHGWLNAQAMSPLEACLGFVLSRPEICKIVVGVDSLAQLHEIILGTRSLAVSLPDELVSDDLDLINPSRWRIS